MTAYRPGGTGWVGAPRSPASHEARPARFLPRFVVFQAFAGRKISLPRFRSAFTGARTSTYSKSMLLSCSSRQLKAFSPRISKESFGGFCDFKGLQGPQTKKALLQIFLPPHGDRGRRGKKIRSEEHTSELQSRVDLVCRLL